MRLVVLIAALFVAAGFAEPKIPHQIALSYWNNPTQRQISFISLPHSNDSVTPDNYEQYWKDAIAEYPPFIAFGMSSGSYDKNATFSEDIGIKINQFWDGRIFRFILSELKPGFQYYYLACLGNRCSDECSFRTISSDGFITVGTYADVGITADAQAVVTALSSVVGQLDIVLHAGDISYAAPDSDDDGDQDVSDEFGHLAEKISAFVPYMVAPGNHEGFEWDFVPYAARWNMPVQSPENFWYSFDYGNVHFVSMSTEHPFEKGSDQWDWLENDLANAQDKDFRIVFGHRPSYSSNVYGSHGSNLKLRAAMEPLFSSYQVDLVIAAHDHSYERTFPVADNGTVVNSNFTEYWDACAPVYVVCGTGGAKLHDDFGTSVWSAVKVSHHGYSVFEIDPAGTPDRTLRFTSFHDGKQGDFFSLTKTGPSVCATSQRPILGWE